MHCRPLSGRCWSRLAATGSGVLLMALALAGLVLAQQGRPPNIVLIIGDDHGYPYFGFTGSPHVHTPNMDSLAAHGAVFHLGHTTSNHCRPALQTLMTGLYPAQYDLMAEDFHAAAAAASPEYQRASDLMRQRWDQEFYTHVMREFTTLPAILAGYGYRSFQGGKWWEHSFQNGGFTEGMSTGWKQARRGEPGWFLEFMGGDGLVLARETQQPVYDFIDRNADTPFFIWYAPSLPHTPFDAPEAYASRYASTGFSESAKAYYSNCTWFDDGVGRLVDHIDRKGLSRQTLFVYVNDNGWEQEPFVEYADAPELLANGGRKGKLSLHDLAFRTPVILRWDGVIAPGTFSDVLVSTVDLLPTILDYAGVPQPDGLPGHSLRPVIEGGKAALRDALIGRVTGLRSDDNVMGRRAEGYYVRTRRWHFIWYKDDDRMALYDMISDPQANNDVAADHPELAGRFLGMIDEWLAGMLPIAE